MKQNQLTIFLLLSIAITTIVSCTSEPDNQGELIIGKWELQSATRNGKETGNLEGLYYEFQEEGRLLTNLPTTNGESTYDVEGSTIKQLNNGQTIEYTIEEVGDSNLTLSTQLKNTPFQFVLKRADSTEQ